MSLRVAPASGPHASQLTAVASPPEMLALNHERVAGADVDTCKPICSRGRGIVGEHVHPLVNNVGADHLDSVR